MEICSAIVYVQKECLNDVMAWLRSLKGVDVHQHDVCGKIIITIEEDAEETILITKTLTEIHHYDGVLSVSLVSQYSES